MSWPVIRFALHLEDSAKPWFLRAVKLITW
jgi:hypothetical protein